MRQYSKKAWNVACGFNDILALSTTRDLAAAIDAAYPGWQPISTAPKDGEFLAYGCFTEQNGSKVETIRVAEYSGDKKWPWETDEGLHHPDFFSHWMPLPTPPETE
jgi:hypothetical protein